MTRVPIVRREADGTITDGTCAYEFADGYRWFDFRDLDGEPMILPPGASFEMVVDAEGGPA